MHAELAAVQALLAHRAAHELDDVGNVVEGPEQLPRTSIAPEEAEGSGQAKTLDADMLESSRDDLTCPICMVCGPALSGGWLGQVLVMIVLGLWACFATVGLMTWYLLSLLVEPHTRSAGMWGLSSWPSASTTASTAPPSSADTCRRTGSCPASCKACPPPAPYEHYLIRVIPVTGPHVRASSLGVWPHLLRAVLRPGSRLQASSGLRPSCGQAGNSELCCMPCWHS